MKYLIGIIILISTNSFGQHFKKDCAGDTVSYRNGGLDHFGLIMFCPYVEYKSDSLIPEKIKSINRQYLVNRIGMDFFNNKVIFREAIVIESEKFDELKKVKRWISQDLCNPNVKYGFEYYIEILDGLNFNFTTVYDSLGIMISPHQVPDVNLNSNFDNLISMCQAKVIAEKDKKFKGELVDITMEYSEEHNTFVWIAQKPELFESKNRKVTARYIIISGLNGKVLGYFTEKGIRGPGCPRFR